MTADPLLLGIDIGTSRIKALLLDRAGRTVRVGAVVTPFRTTGAGTEMTPAAMLAAVASLLAGLGDLSAVDGVGISSLGESGTMITNEGASLPLIPWHDTRGAPTAAALAERFGDDLVRRTGRPARPMSTVAQLGWWRAQGADLSGTWVGAAGLLLWSLTGATAQDPSLAATTGAFDPVTGHYLSDVLAAAGVGDVRFAEVSPGGTRHGRVAADPAQTLGLTPGIPVTVAGHDHLVGAVGAGAQSGDVVDSMGSGEPLLTSLPDATAVAAVRARFPATELTLSCWPGDGAVAALWERVEPGLALGRLARVLGRDRDDLEALAVAAGPQDPWPAEMLPVLERQADDSPRLRRALAGLDHDPPGEVWAAALETYAEVVATADRGLREATGATTPTVVVGGGLRSARWIAAKRRRAPAGLRLVAEPEATARGAAVLAGVAAGAWPHAHRAPNP